MQQLTVCHQSSVYSCQLVLVLKKNKIIDSHITIAFVAMAIIMSLAVFLVFVLNKIIFMYCNYLYNNTIKQKNDYDNKYNNMNKINKKNQIFANKIKKINDFLKNTLVLENELYLEITYILVIYN